MQLNKLKMTQNKENVYIICIFIEDTSIFIESIVNYCINWKCLCHKLICTFVRKYYFCGYYMYKSVDPKTDFPKQEEQISGERQVWCKEQAVTFYQLQEEFS